MRAREAVGNGIALARLPRAVRCELRYWLDLLLDHHGDDPLRQRRLLADALDEMTGRPDLRAWAMIGLGTPSGAPGVSLSEHLRWLHQSLEVLPRLRDPAVRVLVLATVATVLAAVGDPGWRRLADRMLAQTDGLPDSTGEVRAYESVGCEACYAGHHEIARRLLTATRSGAVACRDRPLELRSQARLVLLDYCNGRWEGLRERADFLAGELAGSAEDAGAGMDVEAVSGCLALARGELDASQRHLTSVMDRAELADGFDLLPIPANALIRQDVDAGDLDAALATARRVLDGIEARGIWAPAARILPSLAQALVEADLPADAPTMLGTVRERMRGLDVPLGPAATDHAQGFVTAGARQWLPAAAHFLSAADRYEPLACRYEAAQAREQAAECLFRAGDPRAGRVLRAAVATYQHLGAEWDTARAARTADRHGMALPAAPRGRHDSHQLSPRQRQVAHLAATGLTNEEIARRLSLSARTVDKHVCAALRKLGLHSRRSLANHLSGPA